MRLPVINDSDYDLILYSGIFNTSEDIKLRLEIINNVWNLKSADSYYVMKDGYRYDSYQLNDKEILQIFTENRETLTIIVREILYPLAVFDKYDLTYCSQITIGKREDMDICYDYLGLVSREHTILYKTNAGWTISNKSQNGIYVNSKWINEEKLLEFGDHISVIGMNLIFLGDILAIDNSQGNIQVNTNVLPPYVMTLNEKSNSDELLFKDSRQLLHRAPRNIIKIDREPVEVESPPAKPEVKEESLIRAIIPSLTMSLPMMLCGFLMIYSTKKNGNGNSNPFMYMGIIMAVSSALVSVITTLLNSGKQGKQAEQLILKRFDSYSKYLKEVTEQIRNKYNHNRNALHTMYKSAQECTMYDVESGLLWNRNEHHEDFLSYRLGIGDLPSPVPIIVGKEKFSMDEDSLENKPSMIKENYATIYDVPVNVDFLKHKIVGLIGGEDYKGAVEVVRLLATQIAANNCYTDVKMVFVYDKSHFYNAGIWDFAKWFPHVWSEDKKVRYIASDRQEASDIFYEIAKTMRQRDEVQNEVREETPRPYYIMFLINPELAEGELIAKYIYNAEPKYGMSTIIVANSYANLPNACEYIIENDSIFQGCYGLSQENSFQVKIAFDDISLDEVDTFARKLSNIYVQETGTGGDIPSSITFFDMYGVSTLQELNVLDRWRKNRTYDNIKGLLGQKAGGADCYLDVHEKYHGPHGLVAGTTGSGKSETLQTYMLSLAVNYSPDDIGFFIIDYKGGGMANLFNGLPHLIGQISNLSGNQVRRAMVSIKSENRRRQRIFNESGVNNINLYTKLYKNNEATLPVPHLFIIIDEFAELKREEPDFMRELISVAQVGRSLGVHLILATQKPSGTVDDNIWSNSKFRLCLRVADKQDSNDMLHKPDAAYLTQSGRCFLQVGSDEVFELFQSGFSGAVYDEDEGGSTDIAKLISLTGRADLTGNYAKQAQKERMLYKWYYQIGELFGTALQNNQLDLNTCFANEATLQTVFNDVYAQFEKQGIEYPVSAYNTARLEDYIRTYAEAVEYQGDVILNLMMLANQKKVKMPQAKERTQLDAVKDYLSVIARENGYNHELQLWMPVLPTHLYLEEFRGFRENRYDGTSWPALQGDWSVDIIVGLFDDPQNQAQMPLKLNFTENGHHAVCGMVVSGRSTSLQTITYALITKYSPAYINIYAMDFSSKMMSAFESAPHMGSVMYEGDYDRIAKFFIMIKDILDERKQLFRGGNYSQYVQVHGVKLPMILLIIDNFGAFNEKTEEKYLQDIITLSKEGVSHGIYLLLSSNGFGSADIPNRVAENIKTVITTEMADKFAYLEVTHAPGTDVIPEAGIKGRGLALYGNRALEYQTALAFEAPDDYSRLDKIATYCSEMAQVWTGRKARPVPEIPEKAVWSEFSELEEFENRVTTKNLLPIGYDAENASVYSLDMSKFFCYLITGTRRSGKKNFLRVLIQSAKFKDCDICVIDSDAAYMKVYEEDESITYLNSEEGIYNYFLNIIPEFKKRSMRKRELVAKDMEESEIFEVMSEEKPIFVFISDFGWFLDQVYRGEHVMNGFMENLIGKGRMHNIYFFAVCGVEQCSEVSFQPVFKFFVSEKTGIHFGGNVGGNRVLNYESIPYKEQTKIYEPGVGITASAMGDVHDKIIVPRARR